MTMNRKQKKQQWEKDNEFQVNELKMTTHSGKEMYKKLVFLRSSKFNLTWKSYEHTPTAYSELKLECDSQFPKPWPKDRRLDLETGHSYEPACRLYWPNPFRLVDVNLHFLFLCIHFVFCGDGACILNILRLPKLLNLTVAVS